MAVISPATLERIRAASDIVDIIGGYVPLKKAGANFTALCPFHKEKTPSFNVNPHKQIFHCFGCHKGGDVFSFVKEYENIGFVDAVRRLAERAKIPIELDQNPAEQQTRHLKDQLLTIHEQITQRWHHCLLNEAGGQLARDYLAKRGVSAEAIKLFRLGAAPALWDDTVNWANSKGHDLALVEQAGLIIKKADGGKAESENQIPEATAATQTSDSRSQARQYYDRFRGRLMFPICDEQGRVVGFSGRILTGDEKTAKYVNSPETPIFTKSKVFFGLDKSKRALLDAQSAIVCEGQLDLIACFMAGVQNVVAPQGTAFTDQHARIIKRYVDEVVLCFDSDEAGQNAAVRSLDHLLASGVAVRVAVMPRPHDPDSYIKANGGEAFRELVGKADGFFDYYLNRLCAQNDTNSDKGRLTVLHDMAEAVRKTGSAVLVDKYAQKTALRLGVSPESVRAEFKKIPHARSAPVAGEEDPPAFDALADETTRPNEKEFWLLKLLLLHDELVAWVVAHLDVSWISHPLTRQIVTQRLAAETAGTWQSLGAFLDACDSAGMRSLITEAVAEERKIPNLEQQMADMVLRLRNQFLDQRIAALTHQASQPEIAETDRIACLREQQQLRQQKQAKLFPLGES